MTKPIKDEIERFKDGFHTVVIRPNTTADAVIQKKEIELFLIESYTRVGDAKFKEGYEKGVDGALRGQIENMSSITIKETVNIPKEIQEHLKQEGREAALREVLEMVKGMRKNENITYMRAGRENQSAQGFYNSRYNDALSAIQSKVESIIKGSNNK